MQMFDEGLADKMAESSPLGIGDMLFKSYNDNISSDKNGNLLDQLDKSIAYKPIIKTKTETDKTYKQGNEISLISKTIIQAANINKIDPKLVTAVMMQESGGNPNAVSSKGAKGLMQLMDPTAKMLGVKDPFDIKQNIFGGVKYLASLLKRFKGDVGKALAAYNAGTEAVNKYDGIPPYEETEKYVSNIMANLKGLMNFKKSR
ncbi:MAG: lytic transglycosylase domain-containing protein [candidate division Zixibacteria bacterium]|nr:lytic transglycosylase domain-containing protein [candidate division Zixibacteria bacterium]